MACNRAEPHGSDWAGGGGASRIGARPGSRYADLKRCHVWQGRGACPIACDVSGLVNTDRRSTMPVFLAAERPSTGTLELLDPRQKWISSDGRYACGYTSIGST